ncbi:hypothetical protein D3C75_787280 [compost metagenome]
MINKVDLKQVVDLRKKKRSQTKSNNNNNSLIGAEVTSDDLAIIGAGLTVLGDLFAFLSLVKVREEEIKAAAEEGKSSKE